MEGSTASSTISLGKYRLIAELGHGGMAEVYLAVVRGPAGFNKLVVIKQIRPQLAQDPEFLSMFLDEARLAARLSHPNVVQTNEVGQEGDRYFIAMEYLEGQPLNRVVHRLGRAGGMPKAMLLRVVSDMLSGLHHAHELTDYDGTPLNVVHRDVTPHNVFVTYDGQVKVVDFGIAKAMNSSSETRTGVLKGKVAYMAPEQAHGDKVDRRADLFAVGVLLWEVAAGQRLWKGIPDITILQRLTSGDIPSPRTVAPDVHPALEAIVMRALSHAKEDRYPSALDLQAAIEGYLDLIGERVSARDVGKLVTSHFEADKAKIKGIIDGQIKAMAGTPLPGATLPLLDPGTHTGSASGVGDRATFTDAQRVDMQRSSPSYTAPAVLTQSGPGEGAPRRRGLIVGAAVAAGLLVAGGLFLATRGPSAPPAAATATQAAPADIELVVTASPASARILLDGRDLGQNPYKGRMPGDGQKHELRVEADGFAPVSRALALDKSTEIQIALTPSAPAATAEPEKADKADKPAKHRSGSTAPAAATAPPPPDDEMKRPVAKPKRTLDSSNPYAQ